MHHFNGHLHNTFADIVWKSSSEADGLEKSIYGRLQVSHLDWKSPFMEWQMDSKSEWTFTACGEWW